MSLPWGTEGLPRPCIDEPCQLDALEMSVNDP